MSNYLENLFFSRKEFLFSHIGLIEQYAKVGLVRLIGLIVRYLTNAFKSHQPDRTIFP